MKAKQFIDKSDTNAHIINLSKEQRQYLQQISEDIGITFEDAGFLLINHALQHIIKEQIDGFMNSN